MRINIKTKGTVKDKEVKGIYIIGFVFDKIIPKEAHRRVLEYFVRRNGFEISKEPNQ